MSVQNSDPHTACFSLTAQAAPGVLPRILDYFAKRGLVPDRFDARRAGDSLTVDVRVREMDLDTARYIARCLERIFEVERALVSESRYVDVA